MLEFAPFPKCSRLTRPVVITEKLDGTNAQVVVVEHEDAKAYADWRDFHNFHGDITTVAFGKVWTVRAGSRTRWLARGKQLDNFGFHAWVTENVGELVRLGPGRHFGEWWGAGIQRGYGRDDRCFSLFNTSRWDAENPPPECCSVVPVLATCDVEGISEGVRNAMRELRYSGSAAAPGYMNPEGVMCYLTGPNVILKHTFEHDRGKWAA